MPLPPTIEIVRGVPLRLVDNGDGSYSVATVVVSGGAGPDAVWPLSRNLPVRLSSLGDGSYGIAVTGAGGSAGTSTVASAGVDYTGSSDSTAAVQAALNAAHDSQFAIDHSMFGTISLATAYVDLLPGKVKLSGLTIPDHVRLRGNGSILRAAAAGPMVSSAGHFAGVENLGFDGVSVGTGANGIVTTGDHFEVFRCRLMNMAGRAMLLTGEGHTVHETFAMACLLDTASLAAKTGIYEVQGNGCRFYGNNEIAGGLSALTSVNAYKVALLASGGVNVYQGIYAETADVGIYCDGDSETFEGCIADLCMGNGWEFGAGGGTVTACTSRWNSGAASGTYDGVHVFDGAYIFSNCLSYSPGSPNHKYGFNDVSSHNPYASSFDASCKSVGHTTAAFATHSGVTGASVSRPDHPWVGVATANATPSIDGLASIKLGNGSAQNITNFLNGVEGQRLIVWGDGNSTIKNFSTGGNFATRAGTDLLAAANVPYEFIMGNGVWRQIG